ncbi:MAG: DUF6879 family protein [Pseudonocardiaceae bacterium]
MTTPFHENLAKAKRTAYHLEQRDGWALDSAKYRASFEAFMVGQAPDADADGEFWSGWTSTVREAVARGVEFRRLRIVSEPLSDYTRWEHAMTAANVAAGEQVRWLPRSQCVDLAVVPVDFWVFDSDSVLFGHFSGDGDSTGHELRTDPEIVKLAAECFEAAWSRAIPHDHYTPA